ncbi:MAG: hypothetical protein ACKVU4_05285 [Phycisphaerales bacterium]
MTGGATARQAAEAWLAEYAGVFGEADAALSEHSHVRLLTGKTVISYQQSMDGVPVENALVKVVVHHEPQLRVTYVSGRLGLRPPGGLATAVVSAAQALLTARLHEAATGLTVWSEPDAVSIYDDRRAESALARRTWKVTGWSDDLGRAYRFYVDAATGLVIRHESAVVHAAPDITGKITGHRSPGLEPDTWGDPQNTSTGTQPCPNEPDELPVQLVLIEAIGSSQQVLSSTYAFMNGQGEAEYTLPLASGPNVTVRATLMGPSWEVWDWSGSPTTAPYFMDVANVGTNQTGVDFELFPGPDEYEIAQLNAMHHLGETWRYFKDRIFTDQPIPGLDDNIPILASTQALCNANYWPSLPSPYGPGPGLSFARVGFSEPCGLPTPCGRWCSNSSYSTAVSHEYGHYLLDIMAGVVPSSPHQAFQEGYSDVVAHLVHDTTIIGYNFGRPDQPSIGCNVHLREPLVYDAQYPDCLGPFEQHTHGMLLSVIWLDLLENMRDTYNSSEEGLEQTRQLHVDWTFITQGGEFTGDCTPERYGRSAHAQTLTEVLTADDNDLDLGNGTPHQAEICAAFVAHGISDASYCGSGRAVVRRCRGDCDRDGVVSRADLACFIRRIAANDRRSDCNGDGMVSVADVECFASRVSTGCR